MANALEDSKEFDNQDIALLPIREDIAEWLTKMLGQELKQENLFDDLQTGTLLCQAAHLICKKAEEAMSKSATFHNHVKKDNPSPPKIRKYSLYSMLPKAPKFSPKAKPGSFLARDNTANFIRWCRELGVQEMCMFESEGLVLQKQCRNVLLCLLEVARLVSRYGISPPELIRLERDIEHDQQIHEHLLVNANNNHNPFARTPPSMHKRKRAKAMALDHAVNKIVDSTPFNGIVDIERIGEGRYRIGSKLVFIRMLRNRHIMVRVGGGWDTLEHYISSHDATPNSPHVKLITYTDYESDHASKTPQRKFHQYRTRIPLRTKQC